MFVKRQLLNDSIIVEINIFVIVKLNIDRKSELSHLFTPFEKITLIMYE